MPTKLLVIDDEGFEGVKPFVKLLSRRNKELLFTVERPLEFDATVSAIQDDSPDGLLLDLRLDEKPASDGKRVGYRALSLAQELRTRMSERSLDGFPIVLWSVENKIEQTYSKDTTAHDLFDRLYNKDDPDPDRVGAELQALSEGYSRIRALGSNGASQVAELLGIDKDEFETLDARIGSTLRTQRRPAPHDLARFVLTDMFGGPGPLIDEQHLAARLGVDTEASSDWDKLKGKLTKEFGYAGAFGDAWPRWWSHRLLTWWRERSEYSLRELPARVRADEIRQSTKLKRIKAIPAESSESEYYWTVCKATGKTLDPVDGVIVDDEQRPIWRDPDYLSIDSVLDRVAKQKRLRIHPSERPRIEQLKRQRRASKAGKKPRG